MYIRKAIFRVGPGRSNIKRQLVGLLRVIQKRKFNLNFQISDVMGRESKTRRRRGPGKLKNDRRRRVKKRLEFVCLIGRILLKPVNHFFALGIGE